MIDKRPDRYAWVTSFALLFVSIVGVIAALVAALMRAPPRVWLSLAFSAVVYILFRMIAAPVERVIGSWWRRHGA